MAFAPPPWRICSFFVLDFGEQIDDAAAFFSNQAISNSD